MEKDNKLNDLLKVLSELGDKISNDSTSATINNMIEKITSYLKEQEDVMTLISICKLLMEHSKTNNRQLIHQAYYELVKHPSIIDIPTTNLQANAILEYTLKHYLDCNLPLACRKIKVLCADRVSVNSYHEFNVINNIKDFDKLLLYWSYVDKTRDLTDIMAILYYYMGSPVDSFILFDEVLDDGKTELSAQQLFYYVLTSKEINIDFQPISTDAINKLESKNNKSESDYYYLGLIHLLCDNITDGLINLELANTPYANAVYNHFKKINTLNLNPYSKAQTINIDYISINQFEEFLHLSECYIVCIGKTKRNLWSAFKLSEDDKKANGTIENFIVRKQAPLIENTLIKQCRSSLIDNVSDDKILKQKKDRLKYLLYEISPDIRDIFDVTDRVVNHGCDIENQIGLTIEDYALNSPDIYIQIIYYYYLHHAIDDNAVNRLCIYLYQTSIKYHKNHILGTGTKLSLSIANSLICPFIDIKQLAKISKEILDIIKAKKGNTNTPIYIKDKSDYSLFKEEYHRHMVMKKMELGEEVFNQQFRLCQFHDKLVQLDEYLRNYTDNHNS